MFLKAEKALHKRHTSNQRALCSTFRPRHRGSRTTAQCCGSTGRASTLASVTILELELSDYCGHSQRSCQNILFLCRKKKITVQTEKKEKGNGFNHWARLSTNSALCQTCLHFFPGEKRTKHQPSKPILFQKIRSTLQENKPVSHSFHLIFLDIPPKAHCEN